MALALSLSALPFTPLAHAAGVPAVDLKQIAEWLLQKQQDLAQRAAETQENSHRVAILKEQDAQLAALDETLRLLTGTSAFIPDLEGGGDMGGTSFAADAVYAIEDDNPYAERLFGDAPATIEGMIAETAMRNSGHPALAQAGINAVEFRCWFQGLVKQESNFSIGAKSPKAAFGLTQIIPGTAQGLGIYPAYYDDPRLQLDGGARYLLQQLSKFGSMELALAAYNAGPGAVQKYDGIPPYAETQNYVRRIRAHYQIYAGRISGADDLGTLDPKDMVIAESSNVADAGLHYASHSMTSMQAAATRLRAITARIGATASVKEAMDLNTYARAEVTRMAAILTRQQATQRKVEAARYALLLQAYAEDETYLHVRLKR
ncbi:lytic transglycosylase domain-containing protein [Paracoccus sp. MBLB3053]|uniref:Lytic transglycosylase domain-containing protein n=1 Tax=Paracoccus aurantius TaxID=3073814 RepID=A0ABU2HX85_9RHOB|nr:lytic transglycosylase domain-containing protein [Paracoccus sp. MBLB3053]MDS9469672.1 lytic transglycosylase domain-containing protein [Paracoccus sp. MBLB3053]